MLNDKNFCAVFFIYRKWVQEEKRHDRMVVKKEYLKMYIIKKRTR